MPLLFFVTGSSAFRPCLAVRYDSLFSSYMVLEKGELPRAEEIATMYVTVPLVSDHALHSYLMKDGCVGNR